MPVDLQRKASGINWDDREEELREFLIATVVQTVVTIVWFQVQVEKIACISHLRTKWYAPSYCDLTPYIY